MLKILRWIKFDQRIKNTAFKAVQIDEYVATSMEDNSNQMKEDNMGVNALFEQLNEGQKLVFDLFYYQGYSHAEIAQGYNTPLGTVKTSIRKGLQIVRNYLSIK